MRGWAGVLLFALASACAQPPPPKLYGSETTIGPEDYKEISGIWTRQSRIYAGIESKLFVEATYHSSDFRRAFAVAFPDIYGHGGEVTRRELVYLTGDVEQYHTFFLTVFTAERDWNDLDQDDSIWRLTLVNDEGTTVGPARVLKVKDDANLRAVYPHLTKFHKGYLVRFPLTDAIGKVTLGPSTTRFTLRVASALGVGELLWELTPLQPRQPSEVGTGL